MVGAEQVQEPESQPWIARGYDHGWKSKTLERWLLNVFVNFLIYQWLLVWYPMFEPDPSSCLVTWSNRLLHVQLVLEGTQKEWLKKMRWYVCACLLQINAGRNPASIQQQLCVICTEAWRPVSGECHAKPGQSASFHTSLSSTKEPLKVGEAAKRLRRRSGGKKKCAALLGFLQWIFHYPNWARLDKPIWIGTWMAAQQLVPEL